MRIENCLVSFESLVEQLREHGIHDWPCVLLPRKMEHLGVSCSDLTERLRNTWWEVAWPVETPGDWPQCRYLADSLSDALRQRPQIPITAAADTLYSVREYLEWIEQWQDAEDDTENCWFD